MKCRDFNRTGKLAILTGCPFKFIWRQEVCVQRRFYREKTLIFNNFIQKKSNLKGQHKVWVLAEICPKRTGNREKLAVCRK